LTSPPRPSASPHAPALLIALALAPLWLLGMFDRALWTPDEPREADIAWRMSVQSQHALPELAGTPFLEKPPLTYWMSGAAVALLGDSAAAARAPNLVYALIAALALGALAFAMQAQVAAALVAALLGSSALIAYRTSIWLAPDACLVAGCALALLGAWRGYRAPPGPPKALGYALMHAGAALGFMAKSAPGWLVPALALLTLIAWERRWKELGRWELYAGFALQGLVIGPWLWAVARGAQGAGALSALFWHNVIGRFTQVAAPAALDYTSGHRNSPGKYLIELPLYLLPWTLVMAAALVRAATRARAPGPVGTPWRFALAASVPFLVLLSLAATARDIYAAPALLGFGLLAGLCVQDAQVSPSRFDRLAVLLTWVLVGTLACALAAGLLLLAAAGLSAWGASAAAAAAALTAVAAALGAAIRARRRGELAAALGWTYAGYAAAVCVSALVAFPVINRWQDLPQLAQRIHRDTAQRPLALLDPDETTIAMLDRGRGAPLATLRAAPADPQGAVHAWLAAHGPEARVLVLLPGHAGGSLSALLARHGLRAGATSADDGAAAQLIDAGAATLVRRYELPQGRRYALLGPP